MIRSLPITMLFALAGCGSIETASRPGNRVDNCSKEHFLALEQRKKDSMQALDSAFSDLDRNPTQENGAKKDEAAMTAAMAAVDLDTARIGCEDGL